jgi:hypothetical protein
MTKTSEEAVEWLIDAVKDALKDGRASESDIEEWLLAAIMLEEMGLDADQDAREAKSFPAWMTAAVTLH